MRLSLAVLTVALLLPAPAEAGSLAREGTALVFRADPGQDDVLAVARDGRDVRFVAGRGAAITPGPGCTAKDPGVRCDLGAATVIRVVLGDGEDRLDISGRLPVAADLGPGDDEVYTVSGGRELSLIGGDGDDVFAVNPANATAAKIDCGPGDDRWSAGPRSRAGAGCAPRLEGITPRSVSRTFDEGRLTAPASGSVAFRRDSEADGPGATLARASFDERSGALRVTLTPTPAGRRALRHNRRPRVLVVVRTRAGDERGETLFSSRLR